MIEQQKIYSYLKCPAYTNYFNDQFPFSIEYKIFNEVLQSLFVYHLKNQSTSKIDNFAYRKTVDYFNLFYSEKKLPQQISNDLNKIILKLNALLNLLNLEEKIPVFGPTYHHHSHGGLNLKLLNKSIYRDYLDGYISYYLSPYSNKFEAKNDPIPFIIYQNLLSVINDTFDKKMNLTIKCIYPEKETYNIFNINFPSIAAEERINTILKQINYNNIPLYNCKYNCKYKKKCTL